MRTHLGLIAGLTLGLSGAAQAASPPDSWITAKIKLALLTGDSVSSTRIHVDTIDGTVSIHGKVHTQAEKLRAEKLVRAVEGVRNLRDLLQVVPGREEKPVSMTDDRIEKGVSKVLKEEPSLKDSNISVKSVDKGSVLLTGKTDSMGDYVLAVECTQAVPGVRRVFSEIQGPDGTLDWKERRGPVHSDGYLTAATKLRLIGDSEVSVLDVNVDVEHGMVTLFGVVPSKLARSSAEADARKVDGVSHVQNELEVVASSRRELVKVDDKQIRSSVEAALKEFEHLDVAVDNGAVRLSGTVPTIWKQLKAATIARSVAGVQKLNDDLRVAE